MRPVNERWRYIVTPSLIGWVHAQNIPLLSIFMSLYIACGSDHLPGRTSPRDEPTCVWRVYRRWGVSSAAASVSGAIDGQQEIRTGWGSAATSTSGAE